MFGTSSMRLVWLLVQSTSYGRSHSGRPASYSSRRQDLQLLLHGQTARPSLALLQPSSVSLKLLKNQDSNAVREAKPAQFEIMQSVQMGNDGAL